MWVDSILPGLKIKLLNGLTALGIAATAALAYIKEVPLNDIVSAKTLAITTFVVASVSYWLRSISGKSED